MGIISVEQADHLYWLGRYTERVYTTLKLFSNSFDDMIDGLAEVYEKFCKDLDIPNIYKDKAEFVKKYPFDESNSDSIISNLNRAYDNAITLRETISSEGLAYIQLAIYEMKKTEQSKSPLINIMMVTDNLMAFYGIVDDQIDSENVRNIIKTGKRVERIDLYARLGASRKDLSREIHRLIPRVERSGIKYDESKLKHMNELIEAEEIEYYKIINEVESIFQD